MLFNSLDFAFFLPLVFLLYWFVFSSNLRAQNAFIVAASFTFYGWWDWRFLSLLAFSSLVDYGVGVAMEAAGGEQRRKRFWLGLSLVVNLGLLFTFKYYNFFIDNFVAAFTWLGKPIEIERIKIILPVGISFYTFQTLSYSIDVYKGNMKPTRDLIAFFAYVSFFPQLVAGPIERATHLLPQFYAARHFDADKASEGLRQILWGLFKKIVIADNCAALSDAVFDQVASGPHDYTGSTLVLGAIFFAFQIYGDFSGYSDIALGCSRLLGFDLMRNFAFPYFSRDIAEFWRRWHISLSTWFRDYLYIPLGGSRGGKWLALRNTFIIFLVSGFWHGANWTFLAWGALHALYFLPLLLLGKNRSNLGTVAAERSLPTLPDLLRMALTFALVTVAWVFFRAENIQHALLYLKQMATPSLFAFPSLHLFPPGSLMPALLLLAFFVAVEWWGRRRQFALESLPLYMAIGWRWSFYTLLICILFVFAGGRQDFIYFQF